MVAERPTVAEGINLRVEGEILIVEIDRPEKRNALNRSVVAGLAAAMQTLAGDGTLRVGIITGSGGCFSSGMDLDYFETVGGSEFALNGIEGLTDREAGKPLIAAVEGFALAGGCEIALACDLIFASRDASFGLPEVQLGLVAAAGGLFRLPHRLPEGIALEYLLTGHRFSAQRAYELGLVNRLTNPGEALETALETAKEISSNSPLAVEATTRIVKHGQTHSMSEGFKYQRSIAKTVLDSEDASEGVRAMRERRPPVWKGR